MVVKLLSNRTSPVRFVRACPRAHPSWCLDQHAVQRERRGRLSTSLDTSRFIGASPWFITTIGIIPTSAAGPSFLLTGLRTLPRRREDAKEQSFAENAVSIRPERLRRQRRGTA